MEFCWSPMQSEHTDSGENNKQNTSEQCYTVNHIQFSKAIKVWVATEAPCVSDTDSTGQGWPCPMTCFEQCSKSHKCQASCSNPPKYSVSYLQLFINYVSSWARQCWLLPCLISTLKAILHLYRQRICHIHRCWCKKRKSYLWEKDSSLGKIMANIFL